MNRREYDERIDVRFWAIIAAQNLRWIAHCEFLTEQAQRQLEAWGIIANEAEIDF